MAALRSAAPSRRPEHSTLLSANTETINVSQFSLGIQIRVKWARASSTGGSQVDDLIKKSKNRCAEVHFAMHQCLLGSAHHGCKGVEIIRSGCIPDHRHMHEFQPCGSGNPIFVFQRMLMIVERQKYDSLKASFR